MISFCASLLACRRASCRKDATGLCDFSTIWCNWLRMDDSILASSLYFCLLKFCDKMLANYTAAKMLTPSPVTGESRECLFFWSGAVPLPLNALEVSLCFLRLSCPSLITGAFYDIMCPVLQTVPQVFRKREKTRSSVTGAPHLKRERERAKEGFKNVVRRPLNIPEEPLLRAHVTYICFGFQFPFNIPGKSLILTSNRHIFKAPCLTVTESGNQWKHTWDPCTF